MWLKRISATWGIELTTLALTSSHHCLQMPVLFSHFVMKCHGNLSFTHTHIYIHTQMEVSVLCSCISIWNLSRVGKWGITHKKWSRFHRFECAPQLPKFTQLQLSQLISKTHLNPLKVVPFIARYDNNYSQHSKGELWSLSVFFKSDRAKPHPHINLPQRWHAIGCLHDLL